ncbi:uncharacterized protein LOC122858284 [Aphidius gifuensis]|uniref:uncharacterized protein LOC122858284 n=1 Tax=Aphidius gifuensis TaxID=684658 RepID=UPI001CDC0E06|nr:uncharacterized protein LOC122858284 [Aphidius gifuensis]
MNMETADLSPTEWLEKFIIISKEELELSKESSDDDDEDDDDDNEDDDSEDNDNDEDDDDENDDDDEDDDSDSDDDNKNRKYYSEKLKTQYDLRMIRIAPLFASQPRLKKICKDWANDFLPSCFTEYSFKSDGNETVNELHEKANDLKYLINLCGTNLTRLNVRRYLISQMMPIINANCPNLWDLASGFEEIMSQDFENCFSNMPKLTMLKIDWKCKNSTLPMTLAKSLEKVGETLTNLELVCRLQGNDLFSPDSLASVFPRLIVLKRLEIDGFGLSQLLLQSIGEIKNLAYLTLSFCWPKNHPMLDTRINMYPIGNLKNLEKLHIECDYGVRDEFLINLCNNAKKLTDLSITGTNITDIGMSAINNLEQLKGFNLCLFKYHGPSNKNEFITDESMQCLFNKKLDYLNISNCINITDKAVFKLVENLPNLSYLVVKNTKVTSEATMKIWNLTKHCQEPIAIEL